MNKDNESSKKSFFSGVIAGGLSQFVFTPVDVLKVRSQALGRGEMINSKKDIIGIRSVNWLIREIYMNEGIKGFFSGARQGIFGASVSWGMYFGMYDYCKKLIRVRRRKESLSTIDLVVASSLSGIVISTIVHPVFLIKVRIQLNATCVDSQQYKNSWDGVKRIVKSEGFKGLFVGLPASLLMVSHGVVFFVLYDKLKMMYLHKYKVDSIDPWSVFGLGLISKVSANLVSHPFSVSKTRLQDQKNYYHKIRYRGIFDAMIKMYRKEGFMTFYRGILPQLVRSVPSGAVTIFFYEMFMKLFSKKRMKKYVL